MENMLIIGVAIYILLTIIISYITSKLIYFFVKPSRNFFHSSAGFIAHLGTIQIFTYFIMIFKVPTKFALIIYLLVMAAIIVISVVKKVDLKPTKNDLYCLLFCLVVTIIYTFIMTKFTMGESVFDSVHYLDMVRYNSTSTTFGGIDYYLGGNTYIKEIPVLPNYDYQSFYYYIAMIIKLIRNIIPIDGLLTPINALGTPILYFYMLANIVYSIIQYFNEKRSYLYTALVIALALYFNIRYYNISLGFIGNVWRIMFVAMVELTYYQFFKNKDIKYLFLSGFFVSGSLAISSSCLFICLFLAVGIYVTMLINKYESKYLVAFMLSLVSLVLYLCSFICYVTNSLLLFVLVFVAYLAYVYLVHISSKWKPKTIELLRKAHIIVIFMIPVVLTAYSILFSSSLTSMSYFFSPHRITDMVNDYFDFSELQYILSNLAWIIIAIVAFINFKKIKESTFAKSILFTCILFVNPLVLPAVYKLLTSIVYQRVFDIPLNLFTFALLIKLALDNITKKNLQTVFTVGVSGLFLVATYLSLNHYYSPFFIPSDDYNPVYRIDNNQYDVLNALNKTIAESGGNHLVISQISGTIGYVDNIELVYSVEDERRAPKYEDDEYKGLPNNEIENIFMLRDFAGQKIYSVEPNYDNACPLLFEYNVDYLIIDKEQVKEQKGEYVPIYFDLRACNEVIYENDRYVLMRYYK